MDLDQITLPCTDVERSAKFYRRLGLRQIVASYPNYARFECPVGVSTLSLHRVDRMPGRGAVVYFECDDLEGKVAELEAVGVRFVSPVRDREWRWRETYLDDPDGNRLCLFHAGENRLYPPWRLEEAPAEVPELVCSAEARDRLPPFDPQPVVLEGESVRLEPLSLDHADDLLEAGGEEEIWAYMPVPMPRTLEESCAWIADALAQQERCVEVPFAVVARETGAAVGSTRYLAVDRPNRGLEIGWTWLGRAARRTAINTECKLLLFGHAFERLGGLRVQLKTDGRNVRSQRAIARLGARREGTLRRHRICWDGWVRDTVYFSLLTEEWPAAKRRLRRLLDRK